MANFKIEGYYTIVPEDIYTYKWKWCSETIPSPPTRYVFANVAGANGGVNLSKAAAGSLKYDFRDISVTFARFQKGRENWLDNVNYITGRIRTCFENASSTVKIYTKTEPTKYYDAVAWDYEVERDGIIQFLKLTFKCMPFPTTVTTS